MAVRVRPLLKAENQKMRKDIMRVMDGRVVIVLDPDETKVISSAAHASAGAAREHVCALTQRAVRLQPGQPGRSAFEAIAVWQEAAQGGRPFRACSSSHQASPGGQKQERDRGDLWCIQGGRGAACAPACLP